MEIVTRYNEAHKNLTNLVDELEADYGRFLPGSPTYVSILEDMLNRGIKDDRIQPTINAFKQANIEVSRNPAAFEYLRS